MPALQSRVHFNLESLVNRIAYELGVARQGELRRFTSGFPDVDRQLAAERVRIARELHDVVTHSVSVMLLLTGAARKTMHEDEHRSRALLESAEASGRQALKELRGVLGFLSDRGGDAPLPAQPGVSEIPALIERVREAGVAVELCVEGQPRAIPGGVGVAAYRIVQEALTNVLNHAHGASSRVMVRLSDGALELEIVDDGPRHDGARRDSPAGRGLAGMRERVATLGGTLDAHPGLDVGYVVRARIPLEPAGARADARQSPTTTRSRAALRTILDAQDDIELAGEAVTSPITRVGHRSSDGLLQLLPAGGAKSARGRP
jgi:signal transduction histidine kinase